MNTTAFRQEIEATINRNCMENGSNTPDFILAKYLTTCLEAFDVAVKEREAWYERDPSLGPGSFLLKDDGPVVEGRRVVKQDAAPPSSNPLHNIGHGRGDDHHDD